MQTLVAMLIFSCLALAHPLDLGVINIQGHDGLLKVRLEVNPSVGAQILALPTADLKDEIIDSLRDQYFSKTLQNSEIMIGNEVCSWNGVKHFRIDNPQQLSLEAETLCTNSSGAFKMTLPFLAKLESSYRLLALVHLNATEHVGNANPASPLLEFKFEQPSFGFTDFVGMGLQHIGVAPSEWIENEQLSFPKGLDHIFFVFALLLSGGTLWSFFRTITGFTIGHTTTLALVSFGVLRAGGRWIEATIALTICFVAAQGILKHQAKHHGFTITLVIGLIHGLGFAAAIAGLTLETKSLLAAVFGFNVGVEIGQMIIILIFAPIMIYALKKYPRPARLVLRAISAVIFITAAVWFVQRAF